MSMYHALINNVWMPPKSSPKAGSLVGDQSHLAQCYSPRIALIVNSKHESKIYFTVQLGYSGVILLIIILMQALLALRDATTMTEPLWLSQIPYQVGW